MKIKWCVRPSGRTLTDVKLTDLCFTDVMRLVLCF